MNKFNINFIVFSPTPDYVDYIGGSMVCHNLANNLTILGENAYIYANTTKSNYICPTIPWGSDLNYDQENTIIIYPAGGGEHTYQEYIPSSISNINNTVRWLMNDQVAKYNLDDKLYKFVNYFQTCDNQIIDGNLLAIDVDLDVFKNHNLPRSGTCYYTKGTAVTDEIKLHNYNDTNIDDIYKLSSIDRTNYLVSIFNKSEKFICYSNKTFMAILAALCGCIVTVIPSPGLTKEEWRLGFPTLKYGIAYGEDDLDWAITTLPLVNDMVSDLKQQSLNQTKDFISDCYQWLTKKYNIQ